MPVSGEFAERRCVAQHVCLGRGGILSHLTHRTSYDTEEKKHWLTVHKGDLIGRYMLQDNMKPAWHDDKRSIPEKIKDAVDEMIEKIDSANE